MKRLISTLVAALTLIMSAFSAQSADIKITSLPFNITAPGTYVLTGNLTSSSTSSSGAINISPAVAGAVIVDLKGFTITGPGEFSTGVGIGFVFGPGAVANAYPITIRNGTIKNFGFGVWAESGTYLSNITVHNIVFYTAPNSADDSQGVSFNETNSSTVSRCTFYAGAYGIRDALSVTIFKNSVSA
jgi:hypothetical protein